MPYRIYTHHKAHLYHLIVEQNRRLDIQTFPDFSCCFYFKYNNNEWFKSSKKNIKVWLMFCTSLSSLKTCNDSQTSIKFMLPYIQMLWKLVMRLWYKNLGSQIYIQIYTVCMYCTYGRIDNKVDLTW